MKLPTVLFLLVLLFYYCCCYALELTTEDAQEFTEQDAQEYLINYGYLAKDQEIVLLDDSNNQNFVKAVAMFQKVHGLHEDGTLSRETIDLMKPPRCGVADNPYNLAEYSTKSIKWQKLKLTWRFYTSNTADIDIAKRAFDEWQRYSGLEFIEILAGTPDISISYQANKHNCREKAGVLCDYDLDGKGTVLGHAYFPKSQQTTTEIHIDSAEPWNRGDADVSGKITLFTVLVHEIGHTLGLEHSFKRDSVMNARYIHGFKNLDNDSIEGIQNLYPPTMPRVTIIIPSHTNITTTTTKKPITTKKPVTISTTTTTTTTEAPSPQPPTAPDLCSVQDFDVMMVINKRLYLTKDRWAWLLPLGGSKRKPSVMYIPSWLSFLPKTFTKITAAYQRPDEQILMFIDDMVYLISYPNFNLFVGWPRKLEKLGIPNTSIIRGAVNTYSGRTFLFYNNNMYTELDECSVYAKSHGYIAEKFLGVPEKMDLAFRYIDGNLYFTQKKHLYQYNEFTNSLVKATRKDLSVFGIHCPSESILEQLRKLLSKLSSNELLEDYQEEEEEEEED